MSMKNIYKIQVFYISNDNRFCIEVVRHFHFVVDIRRMAFDNIAIKQSNHTCRTKNRTIPEKLFLRFDWF